MHKNNQNYIERLLESDDELPNDYIEVADVPAYKLDGRFKPIEFKWIDSNYSKFYSKKKKEHVSTFLHPCLKEDALLKKTENLGFGENCLILDGVLTEEDIYCLTCIEKSTSDSILLWLLNFFIYKDLQSGFTFLRSCIVNQFSTLSYKKDYNSNIEPHESLIKIYDFEFICKNKIVLK